jgi:ATP-dependent DNA ligase
LRDEIKFDGYRALALRGGNETRVLSRNEKDLGSKFPEVKDSIAALVGFYEGKKLKFAGRVGTGFSDKLLRSLLLS